MIPIGYNVNSIYGNRLIPKGYMMKPEFRHSAHDHIWPITTHATPSVIRMMIWAAERDSVSTPWLHIPLTAEEVDHIQSVVDSSSTPIELVWAPLWEARFWMMLEGIEGPFPDNPFLDPGDLFEAVKKSIVDLTTSRNGLRIGTSFDIWNEFDLFDTQEPVMKMLYPWATQFMRDVKIPFTVSTIIPADGNHSRSKDAYSWLAEQLGAGLPDFLEIHLNGQTNRIIQRHIRSIVRELRWSFGKLPLRIGECAVKLDTGSIAAIYDAGVEDLVLWR